MLRDALPRIDDIVIGLRRAQSAISGTFSSADGRWALVSTSVTATVALVVTWLALAAAPPGNAAAYEARPSQATLPYNLLARLSGTHSLPGIAADNYRAAGLIGPAGRSNNPLADAARAAGAADGPLDDAQADQEADVETQKLTMGKGDTIMGMLQDAGVTSNDAAAIVEAMRPVYDPRSIQAGQVFEANFGVPDIPQSTGETDDSADAPGSRLLALSFSPSIERQITISRTGPGAYSAQDAQKKLETRYQHAGATIDTSLYLAAMQAGIPASVVIEMIHMFSYDVDFQRDIHPGDSFEVFFNNYYTPDGHLAKAGDVLAATMVLDGQTKTLYRFDGGDGVEYFDSKGRSAKTMLLKTPVDGARISSGFGMRFHPILGYTRMHKGIDFAVPVGTPVMAAGTGKVIFAGKARGYGNFMIIRHANGYSTAYGHLSRFAVHAGAHVHQGQIVAYSGNTGLTTGPHLHYEVRIHNVQVNPAKVKVASGRTLKGKELAAFVKDRNHIQQMEAALPMKTKLAAAAVLRDTSNQ